LKALTGLVLCPLCASTGFAAEGAHWTYEGNTGPEKWGDLDAASKACSVGSQQSPIDITGSIKAQLPPLRIAWGKTADSNHMIQLNAAEGSTLTFGGEPYAQCSSTSIVRASTSSAAKTFRWKRILSMLMLGRARRGWCVDDGGKA
jgi:carbonic anhydrase